MRVVLGADGYGELVRLLDVIYRAGWDDVPGNQSERSRGSRNVVTDYSPGGREGGADYMYIDPVTGNPVDAWAAKRRRAGMYAGYFPCADEAEHRRDAGGFPRTFHDVEHAAGELLPDPEDVVPNRGPRAGPILHAGEVIAIIDDEPEVEDVRPDVRPAATRDPQGPAGAPGSGSESSKTTGTIERNIRESYYGSSYSTVQYSEGATDVIQRFLNQVMVTPVSGLAAMASELVAHLREHLTDISEGIRRGEREPER